MDIRTRYVFAIIGISVVAGLSISLIMLFAVFHNLDIGAVAKWVILPIFAVVLLAGFLIGRHYRGHLPPQTQEQRSKAIRANRRLAWMYLGGLAIVLITSRQDLLAIPYDLGLISLLIPVGLAILHFRVASKLSRKAAELESRDQSFR
ncbi:MAG TPA: hypothetical protein VMT38_02420 [Terracidiphilus sp.]|nr:hypothetical protein [Terracidiphilus sp.]